MNTSALISPATPADLPLLLQLVGELAAYEHLTHQLSATPALLERGFFGDPPLIFGLIARVDEEVVGFATYCLHFSTFVGRPSLWVEDIFVRPQARKAGHGMALFRALAAAASARDCGRMEWSVLNWNQTAIDFYRRCGGTLLDEWTMVRLDADGVFRLKRG